MCPKCARWNLTPLEERWEAFDECERAYRETRKRVSTDNIALARLRDGTDLIRIGQPLRPEFAAWRYERVIRKRRWKTYGGIAIGAGATLAFNAPYYFAAVLAPHLMLPSMVVMTSFSAANAYRATHTEHWRRHMSIPLDAGELAHLTLAQLRRTQFRMGGDGELRVTIVHDGRRRMLRRMLVDQHQTELVGTAAHEVLRRVIVGVNHDGAARAEVRVALDILEAASSQPARQGRAQETMPEDPLRPFMHELLQHEPWKARAPEQRGLLRTMHTPYRVALEMLLHEEDERRAMAGELGALYARWEEAERIAKISDGELTRAPLIMPS